MSAKVDFAHTMQIIFFLIDEGSRPLFWPRQKVTFSKSDLNTAKILLGHREKVFFDLTQWPLTDQYMVSAILFSTSKFWKYGY